MQTSNRPVFLHLMQIRLPLTGWVSILHRLTGVLLFLFLPLPLYLWQLSLESPQGYLRVQDWLGEWPLKLVLLVVLWWLFHHFISGIRFLFVDIEWGVTLKTARRSAMVVLVADVLFLLAAGGWLL